MIVIMYVYPNHASYTIRSSPWAKENSIIESMPITLAIYDHWHHQLFQAKVFQTLALT